MRGIFLDIDTVDRGDLDLGALRATLSEWTFHAGPAGAVGEPAARADVMVSNKVEIDAHCIRRASRLKLICIAATGTNNVDLAAARARGVTVCNVRSYATPSVVEHVFGLILCLTRNLPHYLQSVADGRWQAANTFCLLDHPIRELAGQSLGVIGHGELGAAVAAMGRAFGMQVLVAERRGAAPRPGRLPFDEVLGRADIVTLHCPLTPATRNLIGKRELALMGPDTLLINTARGGIVNEADLAEALRTGRIGGAAVDVLSREPPASDNPLLAQPLGNLIVTPHIAWASRASRQRLVDGIAANIAAFLSGRPRNVVSA